MLTLGRALSRIDRSFRHRQRAVRDKDIAYTLARVAS